MKLLYFYFFEVVLYFQSGGIVAAYGSGITEDWLTTGVCFDAVSITIVLK